MITHGEKFAQATRTAGQINKTVAMTTGTAA